MSAEWVRRPGAEGGPCEERCAHARCAWLRAVAASTCGHCGGALGYERRLYDVTGDDDAGRAYVHAACAALEALEGGARVHADEPLDPPPDLRRGTLVAGGVTWRAWSSLYVLAAARDDVGAAREGYDAALPPDRAALLAQALGARAPRGCPAAGLRQWIIDLPAPAAGRALAIEDEREGVRLAGVLVDPYLLDSLVPLAALDDADVMAGALPLAHRGDLPLLVLRGDGWLWAVAPLVRGPASAYPDLYAGEAGKAVR